MTKYMPVTRFVADIITVNDKLRIPANGSLKCGLGGRSERKIVSIQIKSQTLIYYRYYEEKVTIKLLKISLIYSSCTYMCVCVFLNHILYISNLSVSLLG